MSSESERASTAKRQPVELHLNVLIEHAWGYFKRFFLIWLIIVVAFGGFYLFRTLRNYRPMYKSEAIFSVSAQYESSTDIMSFSFYYDNTAAKQVEAVFGYILNSDLMREKLRSEMNTNYINGTLSASSVAGTNLFVMTAVSSNPQTAFDLVNAAITVYPQISSQIIGATQISLSQQPEMPKNAYNSVGWKGSLMKGMTYGILVDLVLLMLLALMRRTVTSSADVSKFLNLTCLANLPTVKQKHRTRKNDRGDGAIFTDKRAIHLPYDEAFRSLKLKLLRKMREDEKVIMFTSSIPSEGKSTIAANTALSLARDGKKVLLIDGDLRGQSIKHALGITEPSVGLADYLKGVQGKHRFLKYGKDQLYIFASDEDVSSPIPLLKQDKLEKLFKSLRPMVDYIILDTPPCGMMADSTILSRYADEVVYVIRSDYASQSQIYDGVQMLFANGANVAGFILNGDSSAVSHKSSNGYGYRYGSYGGYGSYGNKGGYGRKKGYSAYGSYEEENQKLIEESLEEFGEEAESEGKQA